jgi:hypothetical protein
MNAAIEWDGIAARFGRGFGSQAQETYEWIQRLNEEMGINIQQFMQYSSIYATMLTGFGVEAKDAREMALGYTELTYDIWAGYNDVYKTFEEASEAVKSAIAGEVEPIRRAGFTIVESTLQQTAANHGLNISLEKATEAEKSYLRYLTLVNQAQSQGLIGTYAKELNTGEGLMRTFSQQLKSLAQAFGSLFLPILVRVMPVLQAFVKLLTEAVHWIAGLFGVKIQEVNFSNFEDGAGAIDNVAQSATGAGDALGNAAKAAKELKNATLGIDELNVISPPSASGAGGGSGGAGGAGGGSGFDSLDIESLWDESIFKDIQDHADAIKAKLEAWLPVIGTIAGALGALTLTSLIKNIGEAIAEMNVLQKIFSSVAIVGIEAILVFAFADNYLDSGNLLNLVGEALVTAGAGYLLFKAWGAGGIALSLGVSIVAQLIALETSLADGTVTLSSPEAWVQGIFTMFTGALGGLILSKYTAFFPKEGFVIGLAVSASLVLSTMRMGAIDSGEIESGSLESWILELGSVLTAGLAGKFLGTAFYGARGGPAGAMIGVTAGLALNLVATIGVKGEDFGNEISDWINVAITGAMAAFTGAKLWKIIGTPVKTALAAVVPMIGTALTTALGGLGTAVAAVGGGWAVAAIAAVVGVLALAIADYDFTEIGKKIGKKIGEAMRAVVDFAKDIGGGIWDGIKAAFEWVKDEFDIETVGELISLVFSPKAWVQKIIPKLLEVGAEILPGLWQGIEDGWDNFWENVDEFIQGFIDGFKEGFGIKSPSTVFAEIGGYLIDGLWQGISDKVTGLYEKVKKFVDGVILKVKEFFGVQSPSTIFAEIGKNLIEGLWEGINDSLTWLYNKIKKFAEGVIQKVKDFFGVHSPSTLFAEIGGYLTDGLVEGMTDVSALTKPLKDMWNNAKDWLKDKDFDLSFTPSIGSITDSVKSKWTSAKEWWDKKKSGMKTYTPSIGSIYEKVKERWDNARDWWNKKKSKLNSYTPSIGSIYEPLSVRWKNARDWWNKKKPKLTNFTPTVGSITDKLKSAWSSAKTWWNKNVRLDTKLNIKVPTVKVKWETASAFGKSFKYPTGFDLKFAAAGGIFDAGSLIWAGERGAEVVANAGGGKTGVMNIQQMQDAVYEGVYAAVMAANRASQGDGGQSINVYLDGKQITASVEKRQRERGASIMGNQVYNYG